MGHAYGSIEVVVTDEPKQPDKSSSLASALSNFSIQYNYQSASIALAVMSTHNDIVFADASKADFPSLPWVDGTLLATVFAGSIAGMLCMGYLGDQIGCRKALVLTKFLALTGALLCALLPWGPMQVFWALLAFGRFVLGVGLGGAYPLSAACASAARSRDQVEKAALAFVWQAPGAVAPYLVALLLVQALPHEDGVTSLQFRLIMGLGAVPAFAALLATAGKALGEEPPVHMPRLSQALQRQEHFQSLLGTAGTWFLFDVAAYGTVIFTPQILTEVFGHQQSLVDLALQSSMLSLLAIPATIASVVMLPRWGARAMNTYGFAANAICFAMFAGLYRVCPEQKMLLFMVLCILNFTLNCGPNVATYVLPLECFPAELQSTFHGVSAAAGKIGALVGTFLFPVMNRAYGVPAVMGLQAIVCIAGAVLSHTCLKPKFRPQ